MTKDLPTALPPPGHGSPAGESPGAEPDLASALQSAPVLIWISADDKGGVYFNDAWLDFTGRSLEQELGDGWMESVHPEDLPSLQVCADAFTRRQPFQVDFRLRRRDGAWRWVLDKGAPRFAPDGTFLGFIGCCIDITERRQTESNLRASEDRFQRAQQAASVGTFEWDIAADRIDWSPGMFRLHRIDPATPPEGIYAAWLESVHPDDRERADRETRSFVEGGDELSIEFRSRRADGSVRWIQGRGRTIRDEAGRPLRMIGANFDVTERRAAEEALRQSEQRLRDIAENFPGIIFRRITYPDGRIEYPYFSGADTSIFNVPREQVQAIRTMEDVARYIHVEDLGEMLARYEKAAAELTPLEVEGRVVGDDGEVRWLRSISRPRPRGDGALIWDGVMLDVTEQHREQGERERAATMLTMAMDVAGIGTWEYDLAERTIVGSPVTNAIFGVPEDSRPRPIDAYMPAVHPEDVDSVRGGLIKGGEQKTSTAREYRVIGPAGETRWIASRGSYVRLADGSERLIGALYDITERKRQEQEREAALRQHRTLLREMNHRIKNNLQMVGSVLALQAGRIAEPGTREQLMKAIGRVKTIGELHAQFRLGKVNGQIDFAEYLEQMCERLRASVLAEGRIELGCRTVPCIIDADRAVPLGLIVNELVTNSIKYAFPDAGPGTISITLEHAEGGGMALTVADSGPGMPPEAERGRGLGAQLIEGLRSQIGGTVEIRNGPGLTCTIRFPE